MKKLWLMLLLEVFIFTAAGTAAEDDFSWSVQAGNEKLTLTAVIVPEAYLYAESVVINVLDADNKQLTALEKPAVVSHRDDSGTAINVYPAGRSVWRFAGRPPFRVKVNYQGCKQGICFMPEVFVWPEAGTEDGNKKISAENTGKTGAEPEEKFRVLSGIVSADEFIAFIRGTDKKAEKVSISALNEEVSAEQQNNSSFSRLQPGSIWWMLAVILGGLALNLTPCVLPMIPVNLAILGAGENSGENGKSRSGTGFFRGCVYALGMMAAYGVLGGLSVGAGMKFGSLNSSPVFNVVVAIIFIFLALAMLGVFNIDFQRFGGVNWNKFRFGKNLLAFFMGAVAALLAGACVAPVVISVLIFSAERYAGGDVMAAFYPLLLGFGMALPWPFAGAGLGVLPRPGKFMVYVKYVFAGFIFLMAGYYFVIAVRLGSGEYDAGKEIRKLEEIKRLAAAENRPLLIDFWASWCKNCSVMEKTVLSNEKVKAALKEVSFVKFQAEKLNDPEVAKLLDSYGIKGLPSYVLIETGKK